MRYLPCNLCGSDNWVVLYPSTLNGATNPRVEAFRCTSPDYGEHTQIVKCHVCGHIYANPAWEASDMLHAYQAVEDDTYVTEREGRVLSFRHHLKRLEKVIGPSNNRSLIDVGAYIGVFVEVAQQQGWEAYGIEPSRWAAQFAQRQGLKVIEGTLAEPLSPLPTPFDVVTMWDVVEHLLDPVAEIERMHQLLKPGGYIALHTMDVGSLTAKLMGSRWPWYMAMHVNYFSKRTLGLMLEKVGFRVIKAETVGRYLRLGYLGTRLGGLSSALGRVAARSIKKIGQAERAVPVNFGDLFTIYAQK